MPYDYDDIALLEVYDESGDFQRENIEIETLPVFEHGGCYF